MSRRLTGQQLNPSVVKEVAQDLRLWEVNKSDVGLIGVAIEISPGVEQKVADFSNLLPIEHAYRAVQCRNALRGVEDPETFVTDLARAFVQCLDALRVVEIELDEARGPTVWRTIAEAKKVAEPVFRSIQMTTLMPGKRKKTP